jgi:hypothetical protein
VQQYTGKGTQNASEIIAPHLDKLQLSLLEDIEEGTVTLDPTSSLTVEDVFDIFFVPKFVQTFEDGTTKEKSILEIIQEAITEHWQTRRKPPAFCKI